MDFLDKLKLKIFDAYEAGDISEENKDRLIAEAEAKYGMNASDDDVMEAEDDILSIEDLQALVESGEISKGEAFDYLVELASMEEDDDEDITLEDVVEAVEDGAISYQEAMAFVEETMAGSDDTIKKQARQMITTAATIPAGKTKAEYLKKGELTEKEKVALAKSKVLGSKNGETDSEDNHEALQNGGNNELGTTY